MNLDTTTKDVVIRDLINHINRVCYLKGKDPLKVAQGAVAGLKALGPAFTPREPEETAPKPKKAAKAPEAATPA